MVALVLEGLEQVDLEQVGLVQVLVVCDDRAWARQDQASIPRLESLDPERRRRSEAKLKLVRHHTAEMSNDIGWMVSIAVRWTLEGRQAVRRVYDFCG